MAKLGKRRVVQWLCILCAVYLIGSVAAGMFLAEISLHLPRRALGHRAELEQVVEQEFGGRIEDVAIQAADGVSLKGWYVRPASYNGDTVILLHGVTDNRLGVAGYARMFLHHGYAVLLPDARAHGESGGNIATYGVRERYDVKEWVRQMGQGSGCVYLFGESMGAAIALQATAAIPSVCAVVVESPYSQFHEIAYDRIARHAHLPTGLVRILASPAIEISLIYVRTRYGVDLTKASPEDALQQSNVPTLLIHGTLDKNIPIRHSYEIMRTCSGHARLWVVQGADHGGAVGVAPEEFENRVVGWFRDHRGTMHPSHISQRKGDVGHRVH